VAHEGEGLGHGAERGANGRQRRGEVPFCCVNQAYCGEDLDACADVDGDSGACAVDCAASGVFTAQLRVGCCADGGCVDSCADGCFNVWYEANGQLFGPYAGDDQGCVTAAAESAVNACL
jgi:hypothetical protein